MLAVRWLSDIQPQTQTTRLLQCELIHQWRMDTQTHEPSGCLQGTEIPPFNPNTFKSFKRNMSFPVNQKLRY